MLKYIIEVWGPLVATASKSWKLLLNPGFSNPEHRYTRKNMTIELSWDEGMTWPKKHHLLIDEGNGRGYSCITSIDEETIGILYEGSQSDLIFQKILLKDLLD